MSIRRANKRKPDQIRPLQISTNISENADGSVLFEIGKTKVLCTVTLGGAVPLFLRGKNKWWLTASYAMLPGSTKNRIERDSVGRRNDRAVEISRLIGRSLRSVVNLSKKDNERTIYVDCDVIQADGGTRTACITGAFAALKIAEQRWLEAGLLSDPIATDDVAAVSVGVVKNTPVLDLDFSEDSIAKADFNFVMTRSGGVIEVQGAAEKEPVSWDLVCRMQALAFDAVLSILKFIDSQNTVQYHRADFSLKSRLEQAR